MHGTVQAGGQQTDCMIEEVDGQLTLSMLPTTETLGVIIHLRPRNPVIVRFSDGRYCYADVVITDPEDYVTQVEVTFDSAAGPED